MAYRLAASLFKISKNASTKSFRISNRAKLMNWPYVVFNCNQLTMRTLTTTVSYNEASINKFAAQIRRFHVEAKVQQDQSKKEEKDKTTTKDSTRMVLLTAGGCIAVLVFGLVYTMGSPTYDDDGNLIQDEYSNSNLLKSYFLRTIKEVKYFNTMFREPSRNKLLPDPLKEPYYQPPYTLVLEMTDILVHPEWTYKTGWRFKKRPNVDRFLQQVAGFYEVVIYTREQGFTAYPILEALDKHHVIMYSLFRDTTRYVNGHHVKDISYLNRDPKKVIYVDWDERSFQLQPRNALKIKKWDGNDDDQDLVDLGVFLQTVATSGVDDVRGVLDYYKNSEDAISAFRENQKKLSEAQKQTQNKPTTGYRTQWASSFLNK